MSDRGAFAHPLQRRIVAYLWDQGAGDFAALASVLKVENNSLSGHLERMEAKGLITLGRGFLGRRPRTSVTLTAAGRRAWQAWLDAPRR